MAEAQQPAASAGDEIGCVVLPLEDCRLLIPNVTVAEVVRWQKIRPVSTTPNWHLGMIAWRSRILPVLCFEVANNPERKNPPRYRDGAELVILNRTRALPELQFWALAIQSSPRLVRVRAADLAPEDGMPSSGESMHLKLEGVGDVIVPRLEFFEDLIIKHRLAPRPKPKAETPGS